MEPLFRLHSYLLAAGAIGAVVLKRPGAAKALGAVALADIAGRQVSPQWAALVAGWYPTESAGAAAVVEPLRTVEEVRAANRIHAVAVRPNEVAAQPQVTSACPPLPKCAPGEMVSYSSVSASIPGGPVHCPIAWCIPIPPWAQPVQVTSAGAAPSAAVLAARNTFDSQWAALTQAQRDARIVRSQSLKGLRPPSRAALAGLLMR